MYLRMSVAEGRGIFKPIAQPSRQKKKAALSASAAPSKRKINFGPPTTAPDVIGHVVVGPRRNLFQNRPEILALRILVAIHELNDGERRIVALTEPGFQHARVSALAGLVARTENVEELADEESTSLICAIA